MKSIMLKLALSRISARKKHVSTIERHSFSDESETQCSIEQNVTYFSENFIRRNPLDVGIMCCQDMATDAVLTERTDRTNRSVLHREGGWPKDVLLTDDEQVSRYKKKIEKSEEFNRQVLEAAKNLENCIAQNNVINIYQNYFEGLKRPPLIECPEHRTINLYRDTSHFRRRVNHFSWSPDNNSKLCISHCDTNFIRMNAKSILQSESYIWDIMKPNTSYIKLVSDYPMMGIEFNPKDLNMLVTGLTSGQVATFDIRIGRTPCNTSERIASHRDFVTTVLWNNSKTGTEFFSGGNDGQVIWWDSRNLKEHLQVLLMDPVKTDNQELNRSYGVSVLEFDSSIPTKFMIGTQQGYVFSCNRKGKAPSEKINSRILCHVGPIQALIRNPFYGKSFLTVGDWCARIWVEECRDSSIISTRGTLAQVTDGAWSLTKASRFYLSREDGMFECYDMLQKLTEPVLSVKICDESITSIRPHINGSLIAIGTAKGVTYLAEIADTTPINNKTDKIVLTTLLERETKREKLLETKMRETKLKLRTAKQFVQSRNTEQMALVTQNNIEELRKYVACKLIETDLFNEIELEKQYRDGTLVRKTSSTAGQDDRN